MFGIDNGKVGVLEEGDEINQDKLMRRWTIRSPGVN